MDTHMAVAQQAANASNGITRIAFGTTGVHSSCGSEPSGQVSVGGSAAWSLLRTLQQETAVPCSGGDSTAVALGEQPGLQITLQKDAIPETACIETGDAQTTKFAGKS